MFFLPAFLYILGSIRAAPTTTLSSVSPSFTDAPACVCQMNQRTVTNIVWSFLATISLCAWVAVHPNIPAPATPGMAPVLRAQTDPEAPADETHGISEAPGVLGHLGNMIAGRWHQALPRLELMAWTIIAPEFMVFWAMRQWKGANYINRTMASLYPGWTKTHSYFQQMGGFVLYDGDTRLRILDARNLFYLLSENKIEDIKLTKEDIEDRSKGDALFKTIALAQTTWFFSQCISRSAQNLPTTQLELFTLAFSVLNGFMYFFWWDKPLDVSTPVRVHLKSEFTDAEKEEIMTRISSFDNQFINTKSATVPLYQWPFKAMQEIPKRLLSMCVSDGWNASSNISAHETHVHIFYAQSLGYKDVEQMQAIASIIAVLFGAIHCIGWNFTFPSTAESILWKVSSLIVTTVPLLMGVRFLLVDPTEFHKYRLPKVQKVIWKFTAYVALPLYFLAHIILILEAILTLRDLSPSALTIVQWSSFFPHI